MAKKMRDNKRAVSDAAETTFVAPLSAVDSALASLFASSSGPVSVASNKSVGSNVTREKGADGTVEDLHDQAHNTASSANGAVEGVRNREQAATVDWGKGEGPRKRRRVMSEDNVESSYLQRLVRQEEKDDQKRRKLEGSKAPPQVSNPENGLLQGSDDEEHLAEEDSLVRSSAETETRPQHESTSGELETTLDTTDRTVFLGNVSTEAIKSKTSRKILLKHLGDAVQDLAEEKPPHKVESLRFRSTAFVSGAGPKKATFAKKELMDETTKSTNAYVVYSTRAAAETATAKLNGSLVLDRHLRADLLAHPALVDHKRCIFVGNLSFVDEETAESKADGAHAQPKRTRAKEPADAEEGLWRTFSKVGKVEGVRVVRDKETRVGKGFAYVQFQDENTVEAALLMNDKKFPPMLPRKLRVMRAKRVRKAGPLRTRGMEKAMSTDNGEGRSAGRINRSEPPRKKLNTKPKSLVLEGHRASRSGPRKKQGVKQKKKQGSKPTNRSSRRGAAFKAAGGRQRAKP